MKTERMLRQRNDLQEGTFAPDIRDYGFVCCFYRSFLRKRYPKFVFIGHLFSWANQFGAFANVYRLLKLPKRGVNRLSENVAEALTDFNKDFQWFLRSREELLLRYEDKWVAIYSEKILDLDENLTALVKRLRAKGFQPEQILIQFLSKEPIEAIL